MANVEGRIPQDVLARIFYCCGTATAEGDTFHDVLRSYREMIDTPREPLFRARLASLYLECVPNDGGGPLDREEHRALERCAKGEPYTLPEEH
jgi:hypothetical protein